jgi:MATE family multidrug resistance protein
LGLSGETGIECERYLRALSWTLLPLVLTPLLDQAFLGMGNARTPMLLHGLSLLLNVVLTPILIHVAGLGVVGAAVASNLSRGVATAIGLWQLQALTGFSAAELRLGGQIVRILRIGIPMATGTALFALVYWGMLKTSISPLGAHTNAALGIGFSALEGFTWPLFHGVSLATASLVGRCLGAGRPDLARNVLRSALPVSTVLGAVASAAFYLAASPLTGLFTDDPRVHRAAVEYATVLAASQLFVAWEALSEGVLVGAGDTRTVFWFSAPLNILRIPLAWWLAFPLGLGAAGVWWAINLTTYGKALLKGWAAWRGRWVDFDP